MTVAPPIPAELWAQVPPVAQAALLALVAAYEQRLAALQGQVLDLQERLGQNSTNSSRPPSSDAPAVKRSPPKPPSGKKRGGQPGRAPQKRPPLPPDHTLEVRPDACRRCGTALAGDDPEPLRHQVLELPVIRPVVTEYRLHRLCCPACGTSTCGALPAGVPTGQAGPRLQAALGLLTGAYRLSKRQAEEVCEELLDTPLSAGRICELEQQTAVALDPVVEELTGYVGTQPANVDETSWRQQQKRAWLWVAVTSCVTVFRVATSRAAAVVKGLVGELYQRVLTSDRYSAYNWLALKYRQVCWAHLRRDFQAMIDRDNEGKRIGDDLLTYSDMLFTWWYRVRDGTLGRPGLRRKVAKLRVWVRELLEEGAGCGCAKTAGTCAEILKVEPALWTFARAEGVEPTNNAAERALRHAVLWRKSSGGTDSAAGGHFVSNILSVVATCRQQGKGVLDYLTQCCRARLQGTKPPSLLPQEKDA